MVQSEATDQIAKALSILSSWNPEWKPPFFMTNYSEAKMGAITPTCQIYLCDFHREQAWEWWTKEQKHGLSADDAEVVLSFYETVPLHLPRQIQNFLLNITFSSNLTT